MDFVAQGIGNHQGGIPVDTRELEKRLTFARSTAAAASAKIMQLRSDWRVGDSKVQTWTSASHFKTGADDTSDLIMRTAIRSRYPKDNIISEEGTPLHQGSRLTWVNDGIDGTIPYWSGVSNNFAVCMALAEDGAQVIGVVDMPGRGEVFFAAKGLGAFRHYGNRIEPLYVSSESVLNHVIMAADSGKHHRDAAEPFRMRLIREVCDIQGYSCASVPLALVASGQMQAYLATSLEPEDMAASVIVIQEAGGVVTTLDGRPWKIGESSILAANAVLHAKLRPIADEVLAAHPDILAFIKKT